MDIDSPTLTHYLGLYWLLPFQKHSTVTSYKVSAIMKWETICIFSQISEFSDFSCCLTNVPSVNTKPYFAIGDTMNKTWTTSLLLPTFKAKKCSPFLHPQKQTRKSCCCFQGCSREHLQREEFEELLAFQTETAALVHFSQKHFCLQINVFLIQSSLCYDRDSLCDQRESSDQQRNAALQQQATIQSNFSPICI